MKDGRGDPLTLKIAPAIILGGLGIMMILAIIDPHRTGLARRQLVILLKACASPAAA
jgi:hypothetical protein